MKPLITDLKLPHNFVRSQNQDYDRRCSRRDMAIIRQRLKLRHMTKTPMVGDLVQLPSGLSRIAHLWNVEIPSFQPGLGSYYLQPSGNMNFSGGLDNPIPLHWLTPSGEGMARCWIFSNDNWEAHNATTAMVRVRTWQYINFEA